jgi:hypothetical protein
LFHFLFLGFSQQSNRGLGTSAKRLERERERESDLEGFEWCRERQRERGESGGEYSTKNLEPKPYIAYRNKGL